MSSRKKKTKKKTHKRPAPGRGRQRERQNPKQQRVRSKSRNMDQRRQLARQGARVLLREPLNMDRPNPSSAQFSAPVTSTTFGKAKIKAQQRKGQSKKKNSKEKNKTYTFSSCGIN